jgi:hypothetical protein
MSAKRTLLDMVQGILSTMDADEVNSITDTAESLQVANILHDTFYDLAAESIIPEHKEIVQLVASGTTARPTHMTLPSGVDNVEWIKYNYETTANSNLNYITMQWKDPFDFIEFVNSRDESATTVDKITHPDGGFLLIRNDKMPEFFTTFDDETIIFDSYDSAEETTLTAARTLALGRSFPTFTLSDAFTPDIDDHLFPVLYNEAKSQCFIELKQFTNQKAEQRARKLKAMTRRHRSKVDVSNAPQTPDYGRKTR